MEDDLLIVPSGSPESYCRLCFSEANVEPLVHSGHGPQPNQPLLDLIRRHCAIRLDPLVGSMPCGICSTCRMMLEEFQRFRERCLKCDYVLTGEAKEDDGEGGEDGGGGEKMCHQCRVAFSSVAEMQMHFQVVHRQRLEQNFKCTVCTMKFSSAKRLEMHRRLHDTDRPFRCHMCTADFKTNGQLRKHREKWHEVQKVHECLTCPRVFATEMHLNLHVKSMHAPAKLVGPVSASPPAKKAKQTVAEVEAPVPVVEVVPDPPMVQPVIVSAVSVAQPQSTETSKPFQCTTCLNRFHFVGSIKRHTRDVHNRYASPGECRPIVPVHPAIAAEEPTPTTFYQPAEDYPMEDTIVPDVEVEPPALAIPKKEPIDHHPGTSPCLISLERLDERIIPAIVNYEIPVGKFYFHARQKKALKQGQSTELLEDEELAQLYPGFVQDQSRPVFPCEICGKEIYTREGYKRHVSRHRTEFDFHCDECGRGFADKGSLDRHLHLHTNDFPHKCDECPLGFVRPQLLAKHKERYHGPNACELKLFFCPICQRAFNKKRAVQLHVMKQHPERSAEYDDGEGADQQMEVDGEGGVGSLLPDESLLLDDKTAVFGMLL